MALRLIMNEYSGFVGLNTTIDEFNWHVMQHEELVAFFKDDVPLEAKYAYPEMVASAFGKPPVFTVSDLQPGYGFRLTASILSNPEPHGCTQISASLFIPRKYEAQDQITFSENEEMGFGSGSCRIDSLTINKDNGRRALLAKWLLGVKNRPALFLKVRNPDQSVSPNAIFFFPDKPNELSHHPVRFGEVFVLIKQGTVLTQALKQAIQDNFKLLVQPSYPSGNGLYDTTEHESLESSLVNQEIFSTSLDW